MMPNAGRIGHPDQVPCKLIRSGQIELRRIIPAPTSWELLENSNVYLLQEEQDYFLIDAGGSSSPRYINHICASMSETLRPGQPLHYVFTHAHPDHAWYVDRLFTRYPPQRILASQRASLFLHDPQILWRYWAHCLTSAAAYLPSRLSLPIWSGIDLPIQVIRAGDYLSPSLRVIGLPGHSVDSIGIYHEAERLLVAGDLINPESYNGFPGFVTPDGSIPHYLASLDMLDMLQPELLLTGHGNPIEGRAAIRAIVQRVRTTTKRLANVAHSRPLFDLWALLARMRPRSVSPACLPIIALILRRAGEPPGLEEITGLSG